LSVSAEATTFYGIPTAAPPWLAVHSGEHIGPGLLGKILADCELDREAFEKLL
jgi:hypothetical protein